MAARISLSLFIWIHHRHVPPIYGNFLFYLVHFKFLYLREHQCATVFGGYVAASTIKIHTHFLIVPIAVCSCEASVGSMAQDGKL